MGKNATIVAFRDEDLEQFGRGYTALTQEAIADIPVWLGPRQFLESYPAMRQLIPYVVIKKNDEYLCYLRGVTGNEDRLHGKLSIGIGGHVDAEDTWVNSEGAINLLETLAISARREIKEEIGLEVTNEDLTIVGLIRVNDTAVDEVHVGIVVVCDITDIVRGELTFESSMSETGFRPLQEIWDSPMEKETWTRLTIPSLFPPTVIESIEVSSD